MKGDGGVRMVADKQGGWVLQNGDKDQRLEVPDAIAGDCKKRAAGNKSDSKGSP